MKMSILFHTEPTVTKLLGSIKVDQEKILLKQTKCIPQLKFWVEIALKALNETKQLKSSRMCVMGTKCKYRVHSFSNKQ